MLVALPLIWAAMGWVEDWCCGVPCPGLGGAPPLGYPSDSASEEPPPPRPEQGTPQYHASAYPIAGRLVPPPTSPSSPTPPAPPPPPPAPEECDGSHRAVVQCVPPAFPHRMSAKGARDRLVGRSDAYIYIYIYIHKLVPSPLAGAISPSPRMRQRTPRRFRRIRQSVRIRQSIRIHWIPIRHSIRIRQRGRIRPSGRK